MISSSHPITSNDNLGRFISAYQATRIRQKGNLWGGIVFIVLGLFAVGFGWIAAMSATAVALFWSSVGLLCIAGGVWAVYAHRQGQDMVVQVFHDGLVYTRHGRTLTMRWDDITDLSAIIFYNQQLRSHFYTYTIKDAAGQTLRLNLTPGNLDNAEQLAQIIQQEVTDRQLPRAIADYNAGVPLRFGPLMVTQEGIEHGRQLLPWSEFDKFATSRHGHFVVHAQQGVTSWARVDMVKMTNVFTLLALVERIVRR